jgi:hypothetical protein
MAAFWHDNRVAKVLPITRTLCVAAGAPQTMFVNNNATQCGGDILVKGQAVATINSASLSRGSSKFGGSVCIGNTAKVSFTDSVLTGMPLGCE